MSTYDVRQMAADALSGAQPPSYSGLSSFVSEEGVHALATALDKTLNELGLYINYDDYDDTVNPADFADD